MCQIGSRLLEGAAWVIAEAAYDADRKQRPDPVNSVNFMRNDRIPA